MPPAAVVLRRELQAGCTVPETSTGRDSPKSVPCPCQVTDYTLAWTFADAVAVSGISGYARSIRKRCNQTGNRMRGSILLVLDKHPGYRSCPGLPCLRRQAQFRRRHGLRAEDPSATSRCFRPSVPRKVSRPRRQKSAACSERRPPCRGRRRRGRIATEPSQPSYRRRHRALAAGRDCCAAFWRHRGRPDSNFRWRTTRTTQLPRSPLPRRQAALRAPINVVDASSSEAVTKVIEQRAKGTPPQCAVTVAQSD